MGSRTRRLSVSHARHVLPPAFIVGLLLSSGTDVWAQEVPFLSQARLTASDAHQGAQFGINLALSGDTAIVGTNLDPTHLLSWPPDIPEAAYIYQRDPIASDAWVEIAKLTSDSTELRQFGWVVAMSGDIAAVGAPAFTCSSFPACLRGSVYVFQRDRGGQNAWGEVTKLTASDGGARDAFGEHIAIDGDTLVVSSRNDPSGPPWGAVYVFGRNHGGPNAWGEVAKLIAADGASADFFGASVAVSGDTVMVGAPYADGQPGGRSGHGAVYVFERNRGGRNAWGQSARLRAREPGTCDSVGACEHFGESVAISGHTAIIGAPFDSSPFSHAGAAHILSRDAAGTWREIVKLTSPYPNEQFGRTVSIDGDRALVWIEGDSAFGPGSLSRAARLFSRNQGSPNAWGEVTRLSAADREFNDDLGMALSVNGDTMYLGAPGDHEQGPRTGAVHVYLLDTDRDGIRDRADPCPRDPMNNVPGRCLRAIGSSAVVNTQVTCTARRQSLVNGDLVIVATFKNTSALTVFNPFFSVSELSGGNLLKNGDSGIGGIGSTLSPDVGNGSLEPGESFNVTFIIQLKTRNPFRLVVNVQGDL